MTDTHDSIREYWDRDASFYDRSASHAVSDPLEAAAWRAVDRLPDDRRRAVVLRFVHEMTTAEIAGVLGRSEGAVRVLIHRGLRSVAADLRRGGR